jgi:hypothetical protein
MTEARAQRFAQKVALLAEESGLSCSEVVVSLLGVATVAAVHAAVSRDEFLKMVGKGYTAAQDEIRESREPSPKRGD